MLCFVPPLFKVPPDPPPFPSSPQASGATAFIFVSIAAVGLLTPVGWAKTLPEYALRVGVASRLGPRPVERDLMAHLKALGSTARPDAGAAASGAAAAASTSPATKASRPFAFFVRHEAYDAVPPGLELDPATGALVGVPTMAGSYTVAVGVSDGTSANAITGPSFKVKVLPAL